jgi:hAT family C-terminal dimerisation region
LVEDAFVAELTDLSNSRGRRHEVEAYLHMARAARRQDGPSADASFEDIWGEGGAQVQVEAVETIAEEVRRFMLHRTGDFRSELEHDHQERGDSGDVLKVKPSAWWRWWASVGVQKFPRVALLALRYLYLDLSEVESERLYSTTGRVLESHRSSLKPEVVEALVLLKQNHALVDEMRRESSSAARRRVVAVAAGAGAGTAAAAAAPVPAGLDFVDEEVEAALLPPGSHYRPLEPEPADSDEDLL